MDPERAFLADEDDTALAVEPNGIAVELAIHGRYLLVHRVGPRANGRDLVDREESVVAELAVGGGFVAALMARDVVTFEAAQGGHALLATEASHGHGRGSSG